MENPEDSTGVEPRPRRRHLLLALGALLVLLALALTPPMINVQRLRTRIAANMSASLGRRVTLDRVSMHLLPVPGFTLENLVVSEDPAFGSEPTIRANKVVITVRPSSLWSHHVELSSIRFDVDDNGSGASLNLVRNAAGRWNLESLLMAASHIDSAPTDQRVAGPAPRFPYIEATGARVNLKLADEKMPFSLTEADFALWLPSPQQWRVRLEAKPARTDANVSDPGIVRLEGSLNKSAVMSEVPIDLIASWRDAPLGEATLLLTGQDAGWRGTLHVDATLSGTLGNAKVRTKLTLNDLRRADFVPETTLDLSVDCTGELVVPQAVVKNPACDLASPHVSAVADSVDLTSREVTGLHVGTPGVPEAWLMNWARLFSRRIPAGENGVGTVSGTLAWMPENAPWSWQGELEGDVGKTIPGLPEIATVDAKQPRFTVASGPAGAVLLPLNLMPAGKVAPLLLSGLANGTGYSFTLAGAATPEQVRALAGDAPPLGEGVDAALPGLKDAAADKAMSLNLTCTRSWGAAQSCTQTAAAVVKVKAKRRR